MTRMALSVVFNGDRAANTPARSSAACSFSGVNLKSQAETNPCAIGSPSGIVIAIRSLPGAVLLAGKLPSSRGTSREANDSSESFLFTCRSSLIGSLFTSRSGGAVQPPSGRCAAGGGGATPQGGGAVQQGGRRYAAMRIFRSKPFASRDVDPPSPNASGFVQPLVDQ